MKLQHAHKPVGILMITIAALTASFLHISSSREVQVAPIFTDDGRRLSSIFVSLPLVSETNGRVTNYAAVEKLRRLICKLQGVLSIPRVAAVDCSSTSCTGHYMGDRLLQCNGSGCDPQNSFNKFYSIPAEFNYDDGYRYNGLEVCATCTCEEQGCLNP